LDDSALFHGALPLNACLPLDPVAVDAAASAVERIVCEVRLAAVGRDSVAIAPARQASCVAEAFVADGARVIRCWAFMSARAAVLWIETELLLKTRASTQALAKAARARLTRSASMAARPAVRGVVRSIDFAAVAIRLRKVVVAVAPTRKASELVAFAADAAITGIPFRWRWRIGAVGTDVPAAPAVPVVALETRATESAEVREVPAASADPVEADVGADDAAAAAVVHVFDGRSLARIVDEVVAVCISGDARELAHAVHAARAPKTSKIDLGAMVSTCAAVVVVREEIDGAWKRIVRTRGPACWAFVRGADPDRAGRAAVAGVFRRNECLVRTSIGRAIADVGPLRAAPGPGRDEKASHEENW